MITNTVLKPLSSNTPSEDGLVKELKNELDAWRSQERRPPEEHIRRGIASQITECFSSQRENLTLTACGLLKCPPIQIGRLTWIKSLHVRDSLFVCLPREIGNLTELKVLRIERCTHLTQVPSEIGYLSDLEELDLTGCSALRQVPSEIGDLRKLTSLNLSYCRALTQLPFTPVIEKLTLTGCNPLIHVSSPLEINI
jgi:Leucine-rich repeat (LRR) protein